MNIELKKIQNKDCWKFVKLFHNNSVKKNLYINIQKKQSKKTLIASFQTYMTHWSDYFFIIEVDSKFAGIIYIAEYFYHKDQKLDYDFDKSTLSYALLPQFWNKGICSIAVKKIISIYEKSDSPNPVFADVLRSNPASCSVLVKNNFKLIKETSKYFLFRYNIIK